MKTSCLLKWVGVGLLSALCLSPQAASPPHESVYWAGRSGGYSIRWTGRDLTAKQAGRGGLIYSARRSIRAEFDKIYKEDAAGGDAAQDCDASVELRMLSLVGPFLSYQRADYVNCTPSAHPSLTTLYVTTDLSHLHRSLSLTDLFPDRVVLQALLADPLIREALTNLKSARVPKTTGELLQQIGKYGYVSEDGRYYLPDDFLRHFAFHHVEGNKVAVRIGLSHGAEVWRGHLTQMGLLLPIPARLSRPLEAAAKGREGFLMNLSDKGRRKHQTPLEFRYPPVKK